MSTIFSIFEALLTAQEDMLEAFMAPFIDAYWAAEYAAVVARMERDAR